MDQKRVGSSKGVSCWAKKRGLAAGRSGGATKTTPRPPGAGAARRCGGRVVRCELVGMAADPRAARKKRGAPMVGGGGGAAAAAAGGGGGSEPQPRGRATARLRLRSVVGGRLGAAACCVASCDDDHAAEAGPASYISGGRMCLRLKR
jgi:hypothetical protein